MGEEPGGSGKRGYLRKAPRVASSVRLDKEGSKGVMIQVGSTNMEKAMPIGAQSAKKVEGGLDSAIGAGQQDNREPLAAGEGNQVAGLGFFGRSEEV